MALSNITLDTTTFTTLFPEFETVDPVILDAQLLKTCLSTNEYKGVARTCGQNQQYYAIYLHMAHNLTLADRFSGDCDKTPVKKEKSKNDEIEYSRDPKIDGGTGLETTRYGQELKSLLASCTAGVGFMTCGSKSGGCSGYGSYRTW